MDGKTDGEYPGGSIKSPAWKAISSRIAKRAGNRCEHCGLMHMSYGGWTAAGTFVQECEDGRMMGKADWDRGRGYRWCNNAGRRELVRVVRIVCSAAHRDCELVDHSDANLINLCQRCHNEYDLSARLRHRRERTNVTRQASSEA